MFPEGSGSAFNCWGLRFALEINITFIVSRRLTFEIIFSECEHHFCGWLRPRVYIEV